MNTIHSVSNTSLVRSSEAVTVRNSFSFRSLMMRVMLVMVIVVGLVNIAMAQEEVYKTLTFSSEYNSQAISSYSNSWYVTIGSDRWNMANFNNNNNAWNYVKAGKKNSASVATIITNSSYSEAITKVDVTIDAITVAKINSIKLYTSSNGSTWTEAGSYTKATGKQSVSLASPTANMYYKIEFNCASGTSNGLVQVSKVEYYKQATNKYTVTFEKGSGSCDESSLQEASVGSGVPLPVAYPSSNCSSSCTFCGWSTEEITETICTAPNNIVGKSGETYHPTGDITLYAVYKKVIEEDVIKTYNFSEITGFEDWSTSYSEHIINYDVANVIFASASHQTGTITDIPVTKGGDVSLVLRDSYNRIKEVSFVCRQWTTKAQTITLRYSINGGTTYTTTETTSTNFSISESDLNANTNAVQITFSSLDNQVGIESCTIKIAEDAVYSTYPDCTNYDITWYSNGIAEEPVNYENNFSLADGDVPSNPITPSLCGDKVFVGWSETEFEKTNVLPTLIPREDIVGSIVTSNKIYYAVFADNGGSSAIYSFAGGTVSSLEATGVTTSGLGDYAAGNAPYRVKFDNTGDYMIIPCGSTPTSLTFGVKMIGGNSSSTFTIQASTDGGSNFSDVQSFATSGAQNTVLSFTTTNTFPSGTNQVKIYFTRGSNVGVGPISINGGGYSAYTTFCPCAYGIDGISDGDLVWAGKNANADWNSTINWTRYESGYHLAAAAPTSSNNVYIIENAECEIDELPHINEDATCGNFTINGFNIDIAENKALTINGTATFTNGIINGNVIFGSSAKVNGASTSSHVDGIVTKSGAANSTGFYFPTGSNGNLGKVEVSNDATNVSVQYFCSPDGFGTNDLPRWWNAADMSGENPFNHVSNVEYWRISSTEAITANFVAEASTDMHFNSETADEDKIPTNIQMAFYDNNRWTNVGGSASIDGNTLSITGAEIPASTTRSISGNYTTFGSKSKSTVLPIELISFTANCNGRSSLIEWTTATEKNNDFFVLERSNDAINFKEIARVAGAGNSIEPINYAYTDYGARSGDNYYRLVQVDYDGTSTASEIIVANCPAETSGEPDVLAFPNPFDDNLTLHFENFGNIQATIEVYDMLGRMVQTQKVNCSQNDYEVVLRLAGLSDGTYNVRISTKEVVINRQVIKN